MQSKKDVGSLRLGGSCLTWLCNTIVLGTKFLEPKVQHICGVLGMWTKHGGMALKGIFQNDTSRGKFTINYGY